MKKPFLPIAAIATVAVLWSATALASAGMTDITGTITGPGSTQIKGASVMVVCTYNSQSESHKAKTDKLGGYLVKFSEKKCPNGSTVTVTADKGSLAGSNTGTVSDLSSKLNVATVNVVAVPEFGLLGASVAALVGAGSYAAIRRRVFKRS